MNMPEQLEVGSHEERTRHYLGSRVGYLTEAQRAEVNQLLTQKWVRIEWGGLIAPGAAFCEAERKRNRGE